MESCARGEGKMLAVGLGEEEARALINKYDRTVSIAAFNGPRSLTLAGPRQSIEAMFAELEPQGVFARIVRVDHPFHHAMMQPASEALENALADLAPQSETVPLFSTVTGNRLAGEAGNAAHWGRGVREPVQFAPAINAIADFGVDIWLELGAHPALSHSIHECLASRGGPKPVVISSVRREREHESLLEAAMDLHRAGVPLNFKAMTPSRRLLPLPAYAWDRHRWWNECPAWRESRLARGGRGLLDVRLQSAMPAWSARLDSRHMQGNPLLERIFASVEDRETNRGTTDWRNRIESAAPEEKETVIAQAVREAVGSVLRVKPDTLRDDQPLTDLGLDSLMGVEIENSLEAATGVALPPTSLMRARTIGQIASLIAGHVGGTAPPTAAPAVAPITVADAAPSAVEVDLDALSNEQIDQLLGDEQNIVLEKSAHV